MIHFEIDPAEIDKNVKTTVAVLGDAKVSLRNILPLINKNTHEDWLKNFHEHYEIEYEQVIKNDLYPTKPGLTMGEAIRILNEKSGNKAIIVTDVGQHQMVACRYAGFSQTKSNVTSGGLGTMGFALPAAIGAKMGAPDREVVAIIGDGGYQMTIQELGTIFQNKTAVKIMVLNNYIKLGAGKVCHSTLGTTSGIITNRTTGALLLFPYSDKASGQFEPVMSFGYRTYFEDC